jgi:hypothetical protein
VGVEVSAISNIGQATCPAAPGVSVGVGVGLRVVALAATVGPRVGHGVGSSVSVATTLAVTVTVARTVPVPATPGVPVPATVGVPDATAVTVTLPCAVETAVLLATADRVGDGVMVGVDVPADGLATTVLDGRGDDGGGVAVALPATVVPEVATAVEVRATGGVVATAAVAVGGFGVAVSAA